MMRSCIFIIGTRAQLVKVAPVLRLADSSNLPHAVWLAGQHCESIEDLIDDFKLRSTMTSSGVRHERSSIGKLIKWFPGALRDCKRYICSVAVREKMRPLVVVHGDTLSTFIGALAARMSGAEVVHLESGLSSKSLIDPFPEELVRRLTFRLTRYALCPDAEASARMRQYRRCEVVDTGENTLLDCVRYAVASNDAPSSRQRGTYFVASVHRFQNIYWRTRLSTIVDELIAVSKLGKVHFVLHPPTEMQFRKQGLWTLLQNASGIELEPRMPFTRFMALLSQARGVFSDGGSNQEELAYLGVPTVLFRERSERSHGLGANVVLRKDIQGSLVDFVASGRIDALRKPPRLEEDLQPSQTAILALSRWSACDAYGSFAQ